MSTNKLNITNVIDIRRNATLGTPTAELAAEYNVTQRTIQRVLTGEIWGYVPSDAPLYDFDSRYEVTVDGRIWSNTKNSYVAVSNNGNARLTYSGKKFTVNVNELVSEVFG